MFHKTLFISCATLGSGGAERVLSILSKPFVEEYDRVVYLLWLHYPIFYQIDNRVEIVDIEKEAKSKNILKKMWWVRKYIQKNKPDLILSFLYPWSMKLIIALLLTPFEIVVAERRDPRKVRGGFLMKILRTLLYRKASGIIVQTEGNKNFYHGNVCTIYNPIEVNEELIGCAIKENKINQIVSVGRLIHQKNLELLISAFADFYKIHPNYSLVIYGEGEMRKKLQGIIVNLGLQENVSLPGNTTSVFSKLTTAKMFILSSNSEGMPNALLEAMCLGLPCISTKVSGATDMIQSGKNGILVDIGNKEQMVDAMNRIADDEIFSNMLAQNAVKIYEKTNVNLISQKWLTYLNGMMGVH